MDMFVLGAVAILAAMAGFWAGRSMKWQYVGEEGEDFDEAENAMEKPERKIPVRALSKYWELGSPVTGEFNVTEEQGRKKVRIRPLQGKVYAPASGKITHLYPMGSAMLMRTEFGAEIHIQAGSHVDEMCSDWYRCRVMENEVVRKGALVLEYDTERIAETGADPEVILSVENEEALGPLTQSSSNHVKAGEPILYVACDTRSVSYEKRP